MSKSSSSYAESIAAAPTSVATFDNTAEVNNREPIGDSLNSIAVDLAQVTLTHNGDALRYVAPAGLPVRFRDLLQSFLDAFCFPWNRPIVLPKIPRDEPDTSPAENLIKQLCNSFSTCLILRNFIVNEDRTDLSKCLGFADNTFKICDELELDFLCIVPGGVAAVLTVPVGASIDDFFATIPVELMFERVSDMFTVESDVQLWLLLSVEETPSCGLRQAGKIRYRCFKVGAPPTNLARLFSPNLVVSVEDEYVNTCSMFVSIWAAVMGKRKTMDINLDILDVNDSFLRIAETYLAEAAPHWHSDTESYMFPAIFKHPTPEPLFVNVSDDDLPSGGESLVKKRGGGLAANLEGSDAEQDVFKALEQFGRMTKNRPLLCFHSVKVDDGMIPVLNRMLRSSVNENDVPFKRKTSESGGGDNFEIDFVCTHPKHGIILVEVKSEYGYRQEVKARKELKEAEQFLKKFADVLGIPWNDNACLKIVAFPNSDGPEFPQTNRTNLQPDEQLGIEVFPIWHRGLDLSSILSRYRPDISFSILSTKIAPAVALLHRLGNKLELKIAGAVKDEAVLLNKQQLAGEKVLSKLIRVNKRTAKSSFQSKSVDLRDPIMLRQLINVHFLTPEQMAAWNRGTHQFIIGPPGSGKTILVMGAITDAVRRGRRVTIYCRDATRELYRTFAESIPGGANLVCCKMDKDLERAFPMTFSALSAVGLQNGKGNGTWLSGLLDHRMKDQIQAFLLGQRHPDDISNSKLRETWMKWTKCVETVRRDESGELRAHRDTCVMMDDMQFRYDLREMEWLFVSCCLHEKKFAKLWIAASYGDINTTWDLVSFLSLIGESRWSRLSTVLRNGRAIYNLWSHLLYGVAKEDVKIGHRLEGREPETIRLEREPEMHLRICDTIQRNLCGSFMTHSDVAILFKISRLNTWLKIDNVMAELRRRAIPFASIVEQAKRRCQGEHVVAIDIVKHSYSYEWPIVFYVTDSPRDNICADDVLGISRCTTDLTILYVPYSASAS